MNRSDIHVLVVEDDITIGKALHEVLKRRGFECRLVRTPDEAIQAIKLQEFQAIVLDCMLPKMNGIELSAKLKEHCANELVTILMSGIFKDRNFSKDAVYKTNAAGFLIKPFPMDSLLDILDDAFGDRLNGGKEGWNALYMHQEITLDEVQTAIDRVPNVHGFHLPWIYSLLMSTQYSGHLNILSASGEVSSVTFNHGLITQTHLKDKSSYFGALLVEMGYGEMEDVNQQLADQAKTRTRLGDRLVEAGAISPHAVRLILQEQMKIRLSKTIRNENMEIHLVPEVTRGAESNALGWKEFLNIAADWMDSKLTFGWLKIFYGEWTNFSVQNIASPLIGPAVKNGPVEELLKHSKQQHEFLKNLHFQLLQRASILSYNGVEKPNYEGQAQRLRNIINEMKDKNHFEVLGVTSKANAREISKAFQEMAKTFHPDKLPPAAPKEIITLTNEVFSRITLAHDSLKQTSSREKYLKKLEFGRTEEVFLADSLVEQARILIDDARYADALTQLDQVLSMKNAPPDARLLWLWASIRLGAKPDEVQSYLTSIPPENRHTALFFTVKGLYYKMLHKYEKAELQFNHALSLDPSTKEAKREVTNIKTNLTSKRKAVGAEVSQIVDLIFGKKKRR